MSCRDSPTALLEAHRQVAFHDCYTGSCWDGDLQYDLTTTHWVVATATISICLKQTAGVSAIGVSIILVASVAMIFPEEQISNIVHV